MALHLTPAEQRVFTLLLEGRSLRQVAAEMEVPIPTVQNCLRSVIERTGAQTPQQAATALQDAGLLPLPDGTLRPQAEPVVQNHQVTPYDRQALVAKHPSLDWTAAEWRAVFHVRDDVQDAILDGIGRAVGREKGYLR